MPLSLKKLALEHNLTLKSYHKMHKNTIIAKGDLVSNAIKVIKFNKQKHLADIAEWAKQYSIDFHPETLSNEGFIVVGKAAIFLYRSPKSKLGFIESLIVNNNLQFNERYDAIQAVCDKCVEHAAKVGLTHVQSVTRYLSVAGRALNMGFRVSEVPHYKMIKEL